jgi:hypothetical protein
MLSSLGGDGGPELKVHCRDCGGAIEYHEHITDPILSWYRCAGWDCNTTWHLRDIKQTPWAQLDLAFYTSLVQPPETTKTWPERLSEVQSGKVRYTTCRPVSREELLEGRVRKVLELRAGL